MRIYSALVLLALAGFVAMGTMAALPGNMFNGGGCRMTATWTSAGWTNFSCSKTSACQTSCEIGYYGPMIDPIETCKCKDDPTLETCISSLDVEWDEGDDPVIIGSSCVERDDCLVQSFECMHIDESPGFQPSPGLSYGLCDCYDMNPN